jgi:Na+-translocating ferredoxin:NAD+ oxidoreductase RnfG subunit
MALATRNAESQQRSRSHGGAVESFSGATASAKPLIKQCIDYVLYNYVLTMY